MSLRTAVKKRYVFLIVAALLCAGVLVRLFGGVAILNSDPSHITGDNAARLSHPMELNIEEIIPVTVTGHLLDASCSIFEWQKDLFVLKSGHSYRVLLDGTKAKNALYYHAWMSDLEKIAEIETPPQ